MTVFSDQHRNRGFTVIELLVIISIIMSLSGIAVVKYTQASDAAKVATDMNNLRLLNGVTVNYAALRGLSGGDIFTGLTSDAARMQALVAAGLLTGAPTPQKTGEQFNWNVADQRWHYTGKDAVVGKVYDFRSLTSLSGFRTTLEYGISDPYSGTLTPGVGLTASSGLLFMENKNEEYSIVTTAQLSGQHNGGYGILFDTSLTADNKDTGYALQLDRGYGSSGSIIIRSRTGGNEVGIPLLIVDKATNPALPSTNYDPWWTAVHDIRLDVTKVADMPGKKQLTVTIDGTPVIQNFQYASTVTAANNYAGLRSWAYNTTYQKVTIQPKE